MSWAIGWDSNWYRDIGYGVPAFCDQPGCGAKIDRGLGFVCGEKPYGGEDGCGLYFCASHLFYELTADATDSGTTRCDRCLAGKPPYEPTPDHPEWITHKLSHSSWAAWRDENPEQVAAMRRAVAS